MVRRYIFPHQTIDSKAIKLAIGVLVHTNTSKTYAEPVPNDVNWRFQNMLSEVLQSLIRKQKIFFIDSDKDYPKSAQNISIQPISQ